MSIGPLHWVRFGSLGDIRGFPSADGVRYDRGARVVLETPRGLETGEVLSSAANGESREGRSSAGLEVGEVLSSANGGSREGRSSGRTEPGEGEGPARSEAGKVLSLAQGEVVEGDGPAKEPAGGGTERAAGTGRSIGRILRPLTANDELVLARLDRNKREAFERCADRVAELGLPVMLVDAELLFDGQGLYFYFLGAESPELDAATAGLAAELAETYETAVRFRSFTAKVEEGCGPGCGEEKAEGGCGNCADQGCAIASACSTRRKG